MEIKLFRQLLRKHRQITISINPFDIEEISAIYVLDDDGSIYEVFEIDQTQDYLCNIDDDEALQTLYEDVLQHVVSHTLEEYVYHCNECGKEMEWDSFNWITSSYGLCDDCYDKLTPEQIEELAEKYE